MCRLLPTSRAQPIPSADLHCSLLRPDNSDHTWLSTAYQPSSRCLQLTCLVLIYGPTTPFTHVQATVYHPSSGCLQLTCLALYGPTTPSAHIQSIAYQPSSRCFQLTCLALFYGPTTLSLFTHQSTAYQPPSRCLQLTCIVVFYGPSQPLLPPCFLCSLLHTSHPADVFSQLTCLPLFYGRTSMIAIVGS
jgi:hypothetical protein